MTNTVAGTNPGKCCRQNESFKEARRTCLERPNLRTMLGSVSLISPEQLMTALPRNVSAKMREASHGHGRLYPAQSRTCIRFSDTDNQRRQGCAATVISPNKGDASRQKRALSGNHLECPSPELVEHTAALYGYDSVVMAPWK